MFDLASAPNVTVDRDVEGRVRKYHPRLFASHQRLDHLGIEGVAADKSMPTELPHITDVATLRSFVEPGQFVVARIAWFFRLEALDDQVDLGDREAGRPNVEIEVGNRKRLDLSSEKVIVPAGIQGDLVIGKNEGALLLL